ncbi:MAG TPA: nitronate monooxygenase, partial [Acidimicrobiales bacterium]
MASGPDERERDLIIGVTPGARPDGRLVVGVCRGGGLGVLDLGRDLDRAGDELRLVESRYDGPFGVRLGREIDVDPTALTDHVGVVIVPDASAVVRWQTGGRRVLVEVTSVQDAAAAVAAGAAGLIAKGAESGGRVGEETAFVLLQRLVGQVELPLWLQGGIGLHTAAAAIAGGARGVVLDAQL